MLLAGRRPVRGRGTSLAVGWRAACGRGASLVGRGLVAGCIVLAGLSRHVGWRVRGNCTRMTTGQVLQAPQQRIAARGSAASRQVANPGAIGSCLIELA